MQNQLTSSTRNILSHVFIFLLFLPKINIITISNESAGLRLDDIVLLICFLLFFGLKAFQRFKFNALERSYFAFFAIALFSNVVNIIFFSRSNPLYSLRLLEYFIFYYFGLYFFLNNSRMSADKVLNAYLYFNFFIMALQALGLIGGLTTEYGYLRDLAQGGDTLRAVGLTGGPWEISAIINIIFAHKIFSKKYSTIQLLLLFFTCSLFISLTGSRVSLLTNFIILIFYYYKNSLSKTRFVLKLTFIALGCLLLLSIGNPVVERSKDLLSENNLTILSEYYQNINVDETFKGFEEDKRVDDTDLSWLMRANKWAYATKYWLQNASNITLGVGPGTWGPALDGGWLRILTENGLVGLICFLWFLKKYNSSKSLQAVAIALSLNMLFIDIQMSYKTMSIFLFLAGYAQLCRLKTGRGFSYEKITQKNPWPAFGKPQHHSK